LGVVHPYLPTTLLLMIISVLIASAVIGLLLVVLVQGQWTWFVAVLASSVMAMVIGQYVNQMGLVGLW
jgi:Na+/citrate or Na+/malate symporter